ncbi:O-methyltransferase [Hoyosella subflava]|uniref:O-methyltransferase n=1 Tax=Hoyosella subflava (strain DSM 45089 / JCM 17490 / NBRC 109087 / DQS3-9A1) TaxID=443218 RepID=F6EPC6_HOYSD|nr:O-methyltransferase [Hoyosella subflava]AEF41786.1 O-methyltransferase [Hoyosella subflava DQS3-9A1]
MLANADLMLSHAESSTIEDDILRAVRERADDLGARAVTPAIGATLALLARLSDARAVVEIGTGAGVSGLCLMRGMRADGILTTIDTDTEHLRAARRAFQEAGIASTRTRLINGRALDVLPRLADASYDLVFIDANVVDQPQYVAASTRLLRPGGALVVNASMLGGRVGDPSQQDAAALSAREAAQLIADDETLTSVLIPLGEGLLCAARK